MDTKNFLEWSLALLLTACGGPAIEASADTPVAPERRSLAPRVDHHLHLLSSAGADSRLPATPVPAAVDRLLRERERRWNDAAGLAPLFAADAAMFTGTKWLTGREAIAQHLSRGYTGPYRFKPASFREAGPTAQLAGYVVEGDGTNVHFGFFHLALVAAGDEWRISSEQQVFPGPALEPTLTAKQLVEQLDAAGIERGVVLSDAYYFDLTRPTPLPDEHALVRAENDWTAGEVAQFPGRLVAFCSFNPLKPYALAELERCARTGKFVGVKQHLNGAQLNFRSPEEVAKVRAVFAAANAARLPLIVHVRSSDAYGRADAEVFLHELVAAAPDVTVQVAHLWGGESFSADALAVYADAVAAGDPATRNLYFDVSGISQYARPEQLPEIAAQIRRIGLGRVLYASDGPPAAAWVALGRTLPLTPDELQALAANVAPYMQAR